MLNVENSFLLMIDVQDRLVKATCADGLVKNSAVLVQAAGILDVPVVVTEQYPKGLGHTVESVSNVFPKSVVVLEKTAFSALLEKNVEDLISKLDRRQVILFGIESHVCVLQTALDLIDNGFGVFVVKNACASRSSAENDAALLRMQQNGAQIVTVEMVLFELLKTSRNEYFKQVQALIK